MFEYYEWKLFIDYFNLPSVFISTDSRFKIKSRCQMILFPRNVRKTIIKKQTRDGKVKKREQMSIMNDEPGHIHLSI